MACGTAPAYAAADLGLIPSRVKPMTFKMAFTTSLHGAQHQRDSGEQAVRFIYCAVAKGTKWDSPILMWEADGWQFLSKLVIML